MGIAAPFVIGFAGGFSAIFLSSRGTRTEVVREEEGDASSFTVKVHTQVDRNPWLHAAAAVVLVASLILGAGAFLALASNPISLSLSLLLPGVWGTTFGIAVGAMVALVLERVCQGSEEASQV